MVREDDRPVSLGGPAQRDVNGAMHRLYVLLLRKDRDRGLWDVGFSALLRLRPLTACVQFPTVF